MGKDGGPGDKGIIGGKGEHGHIGHEGIRGGDGPKGDKGEEAKKGTSGVNGADGPNGIPGPDGQSSWPGECRDCSKDDPWNPPCIECDPDDCIDCDEKEENEKLEQADKDLTATALAKKSPETAAVKATAAATLAKAEKVIAKKGPESKEAIAAINVATQAKAAVKTTKAGRSLLLRLTRRLSSKKRRLNFPVPRRLKLTKLLLRLTRRLLSKMRRLNFPVPRRLKLPENSREYKQNDYWKSK